MINKHKSNKIKENSNTVRHLNNGTDHRHSKSCCDQSSPARRTITSAVIENRSAATGIIFTAIRYRQGVGHIYRGVRFALFSSGCCHISVNVWHQWHSTVCSTACLRWQRRKHQSSVLVALCGDRLMDSAHKGPALRKACSCMSWRHHVLTGDIIIGRCHVTSWQRCYSGTTF